MSGNWYVIAKEDIERHKEHPKQLAEIIDLSGRLRDIAQGYLEKIIKPKSLKKDERKSAKAK